jgi:hypothetical protein
MTDLQARFPRFPSHCIAEETEDFDIIFYSTQFWNIFIAEEMPNIEENLQHNFAFPHVQAEFLFLRRLFGFPLTFPTFRLWIMIDFFIID